MKLITDYRNNVPLKLIRIVRNKINHLKAYYLFHILTKLCTIGGKNLIILQGLLKIHIRVGHLLELLFHHDTKSKVLVISKSPIIVIHITTTMNTTKRLNTVQWVHERDIVNKTMRIMRSHMTNIMFLKRLITIPNMIRDTKGTMQDLIEILNRDQSTVSNYNSFSFSK